MNPVEKDDWLNWQPDIRHMQTAIQEAIEAAANGDVPIGAVIVCGTQVIGKAHNQVERLKNPTAHAEILSITQAASALGDWRLLNSYPGQAP